MIYYIFQFGIQTALPGRSSLCLMLSVAYNLVIFFQLEDDFLSPFFLVGRRLFGLGWKTTSWKTVVGRRRDTDFFLRFAWRANLPVVGLPPFFLSWGPWFFTTWWDSVTVLHSVFEIQNRHSLPFHKRTANVRCQDWLGEGDDKPAKFNVVD